MPKVASLIQEAGTGHNSLSKEELGKIVERLETLIDNKKDIAEDIKIVMQEAKGKGFDLRTIREMLKMRAMNQTEREERETLRDLYLSALGLI